MYRLGFTSVLLCILVGCKNSGTEVGDLDGDLWHESDEIACGTNPLDPFDVPFDLDGDGICDLVDDDDDDDGYSDDQEIMCGSDPADYFSVPEDADNDGYCSSIDINDSDPFAGLGDPVNQGPIVNPGNGLPPLPPLPFPGVGGINCQPGLEFDNVPEAPIPGGETGLEFDNQVEPPLNCGETGLEFDNIPFPPIGAGLPPILPGAEPIGPGGDNGLEFD